jgi:biopolymer transport protein ExbD
MSMNFSRLQIRVRNRRMGSQWYALFGGINSSLFSQSTLACVLVLMIIFMMYAPSNRHSVIDPYISRHAIPIPAALRDDALRITVTRDGTIYFGNAKVVSEDLSLRIRQRLDSSAPRKVFLSVDERTQYGDLSIVLDDVRHAGILEIVLLAEFPVMHR